MGRNVQNTGVYHIEKREIFLCEYMSFEQLRLKLGGTFHIMFNEHVV